MATSETTKAVKPKAMPKKQRWNKLRRKLRYWAWLTEWDRALGIAGVAATIGVLHYYSKLPEFYKSWKPWLIILAASAWTACLEVTAG